VRAHAPQVKNLIVNVSPIFLFKGDVERAFQTYAGQDLALRVHPRFQRQLGARSAGDLLGVLLLKTPFMQLHEVLSPYTSSADRYASSSVPAADRGPYLTRLLRENPDM